MVKTKNFIEKSKHRFGDIYTYVNSIYVNKRTKIKFHCDIHGEFSQLPHNHLSGNGCPRCNKDRIERLRAESFIDKCIDVHKGKYDYSLTKYEKSSSKVDIICTEHGIFTQIASNHISGKGCKKCQYEKLSNEFSISNEEFIAKSVKVHGDKYDYSLIDYNNRSSEIDIICVTHGEFKQRPVNHLNGSGCKLCEAPNLSSRKEKLKNKFVDDIVILSEESNNFFKFRCHIHGEFIKKFDNVINSKFGCNECASVKRHKYNLMSSDEFIERSNHIHKNEYNYDSVEYKGMNKPVFIYCETHGFFEQKPIHHLRGSGCFICSLSKRKKIRYGDYVQMANDVHKNKFKYNIHEKWRGISGHIEIECPEHGKSTQRCDSHLRTNGCAKCGYDKLSNSKTKSTNVVISEFNEIHGNRYDYSKYEYIGCIDKSTIICEIHGNFEQTATLHRRGCGCPKCNSSKGESKIIKILDDYEFDYEIEKILPGTKLRFDFYLTYEKIYIEYDGKHHYESIEYFGGVDNLKSVRINDKLKNDYCKENNIKLIRIPYWEYDSIEYILYDELKIKKHNDK